MAASALPRAFGLLDSERNLAVGPALVESLPEMESLAQSEALRLLGQIEHRPSLAAVVGRFLSYDAPIQQLLIQHVSDLFSGVGGAVLSPNYEERESAIEFIARSHSGRLAYLLSDALRGKCPKTRELAANVLHRMTVEFFEARSTDDGSYRQWMRQADDLADALRKSVRAWEVHLQPKALEAAMWMADRVDGAIREKLAGARAGTEHAINDVLQGASDPRLAGFTLRALALRPIRSAAARAISRAHVPGFVQAIVEESWILLDPAVARGCRRVRESPWLHGDSGTIIALDDRWADNSVRLLMSAGGPTEAKYLRLRDMLCAERPALRRAALWHLVSDPREEATNLLRSLANQNDSEARIAKYEVERRLRRTEPVPFVAFSPTVLSGEEADVITQPKLSPFEELWKSIDGLDAATSASRIAALNENRTAMLESLRLKLDSPQPSDRVRALRIVQFGALIAEFENAIYRLANDADPLVRSQCVSMLGELPTPTSLRILRAAVNDPHVRVQANALEAMDHLNVADRAGVTESKLESRDARVRANAVKSLLRMEVRKAGDVLLEMLAHKDRSQRVSALWVIARLQLGSVLDLVVSVARSDPDERVRHRAQRLLGEMKKHHTVKPQPLTKPVLVGAKKGVR